MDDLRVLIWMPRTHIIPGGHRAQMDSTAQALRDLGVVVRFTSDPFADVSTVDIVHGFGLTPEEVRRCRDLHKRIMITPIFNPRWSRYNYAGGHDGWHKGRDLALRIAIAARDACNDRPTQVERMKKQLADEFAMVAAFSCADMLLPNAQGERDDLAGELGVATPCVVVPNAVDPKVFSAGSNDWNEREIDVLYSGRIEPHKNQLGLIEALRGSGLRLTIVGHDHPHHPKYAARCREAGDGWVKFVEGRPQDELPDLYRSAKVHVLPSWFETTGLVSLEAALSGCAVVSTSRGYAAEYLTNFAHYCDPAKPETIRSAISGALQAGPQAELRDRILNNYTWRHTAEATLAAYQTIMC